MAKKGQNFVSKRVLLVIAAALVISTLLVWLPFFLNGKMDRVFANYDGPNYLVVAKCWYNPDCIRKNFSLPLPLEYYPAHFPFYPALIAIFDVFLPGWWAMLIVNVLATGAMCLALFLILKKMGVKYPGWLTLVSLFLPARMLILRSVGAPETLFIALILFSIYFFQSRRFVLSGLFLAAAQATKTPAILLFVAYLLTAINREVGFKNLLRRPKISGRQFLPYWGILLGPMALLPVFLLFQRQTGNFWAYFNSGDNFHLFFPPFQAFISDRSWLGDFWLEDIIYIYLIGGVAVFTLIKSFPGQIVSLFPTVFYFATLFVAHRDISRYSVPLFPFWIIAFSETINKKEFKIAFLILLPAIYLFSVNFINFNVAPIADWGPYR